MKKVVFISTAIVLSMSGCAQKSSGIQATYVSPVKYEKYSCSQLKEEVYRVNNRLAMISGEQDETADKDMIVMGVGLVLFAPALLLLAEGEDQKSEIGQLKGNYNSIRTTAQRKKCSFATSMV